MNTLIIGDRIDIVWSSYGIPIKFANARLDNYYPRQKEQQEALRKCIKFARQDLSVIQNGKGLFLHGPVGTGKTHMAIATAYEIVANNVDEFGYKSKDATWMTYEESQLVRQYCGILAGFVNVTDLLTMLQESYPGDERAQASSKHATSGKDGRYYDPR